MELGQVIASRKFALGDKVVELRIGAPCAYDGGRDFFCPFQVLGIGDEKVRHSGGVDALQALLLGIDRASLYLASRPEVKAGNITFLGEKGIGFGGSQT